MPSDPVAASEYLDWSSRTTVPAWRSLLSRARMLEPELVTPSADALRVISRGQAALPAQYVEDALLDGQLAASGDTQGGRFGVVGDSLGGRCTCVGLQGVQRGCAVREPLLERRQPGGCFVTLTPGSLDALPELVCLCDQLSQEVVVGRVDVRHRFHPLSCS
ncbi:hypothetical protein ABZ484_27465 [Streptomyces sp. NPDC006393]|uniref:hypothetical protein n=1 Tax=Streptomyces sp. NPDC006393 TaxID=3156763 RepID=UPI0033C8625B